MDEDDAPVKPNEPEPPPRRRRKRIQFPRRTPSVADAPRQIVYVTPDKTVCRECPCYPREEPYARDKKLLPCQRTPPTLYELCSRVVDAAPPLWPFAWTVDGVVEWLSVHVGLPQYEECIRDNHIDGLRLLMLEDPSLLPEINIHYHTHIQKITSEIRRLYGTEMVRFARSVGLPPRYPLTHVVRFKSRTGPRDGLRRNMTATDILRWMKIMMPEPVYMDHWDLVWYRRPYVPRVKLARVPGVPCRNEFWRPKPPKEPCQEYTAVRKYRMMPQIVDEHQLIWKEHRPGSAVQLPVVVKERAKKPAQDRQRHDGPAAEAETQVSRLEVGGNTDRDLTLLKFYFSGFGVQCDM